MGHRAPLLEPTSGIWDTSQLWVLKEVKKEVKERKMAEEKVGFGLGFLFLLVCF